MEDFDLTNRTYKLLYESYQSKKDYGQNLSGKKIAGVHLSCK